MASRILASAAAPAPVSKCPTVDLTEPIAHCPAAQPESPQSARKLSNSTASPTGVPVAWHSITSAAVGFHPAWAYALRIARNCPSLAGASRLPCVSLESPTPVTTPQMSSPWRTASVSLLSANTPAPSPTSSPSARASNGEHDPLSDKARSCEKPICV